eukprot:TRINITY_DN22095_c0_g1_i1.p1 TRINITY_DN22095_c0_g1~~TRINITY_DN22095_c0_g1_i1.p1  ORF type:complete len:417 (-),score=117.01 TRINITY_DN22095_c0_g1_i1:25-1275(-)
MACFKKKSADEEEAAKINNKINKDLRSERANSSKIKLLLLGAGESGKSTIAKQMKIIHLGGYNSDDERIRFRGNVYANIWDNVKTLLEGADTFGIELGEAAKESAKRIYATEESFRSGESKGFGRELVEDIKRIWNDPGILSTYARASELQLNDSAEYFFNELDRISQENYIPTQADILHVRVKTTGINEIEFNIGKYRFAMMDVGGQRSERRKWIHCFENVTAIIFCAALSEYDQKLYEDGTTNRMLEALKLFSDITNSRWFNDTPIILFLNKKDLFDKKILKVPLSVCFPEYTGPNQPKEASAFIEQQFLSLINNKHKLVYTYHTCATDTNNVRFIFKAVKDVLITAYLNHLGIGIGGPMIRPSASTSNVSAATGSGGTIRGEKSASGVQIGLIRRQTMTGDQKPPPNGKEEVK